MLSPHYLGGESGHRGLFGLTNNVRGVVLAAWAVLFCALSLFLRTPGIIIAFVILPVLLVVTSKVGRGSRLTLWRDRRNWRKRQEKGLTSFRPVSRRPSAVELTEVEEATYRDWPEGCEGLYWLQDAPGLPGIQWHMAPDEAPYLAVAWRVRGSIAGLEADDRVNGASEAFGRLLAATARPLSLVEGVQSVTAAAKLDTAPHEMWVVDNLAWNASRRLLSSYDELVGMCERRGMTQEHVLVVRWPLTARFKAKAARRGPGQIGWLELMGDEIRRMSREIEHAGLGPARVMSAPQVSAFCRHLQMPSWASRDTKGVSAWEIGLPYDQEVTHVIVTDMAPDDQVEVWYHRTAEVPARGVEVAAMDALWLTPILSGLPEQIHRTIATHVFTSPAGEARRQARADVTLDLADKLEEHRKGVLADEELSVAHETARVRHRDLHPGSGVQGADWSMHITISARSVDELREARDVIEAGCSEAGIASLDWLDSHHGAAQSWTWPVGRGMAKSRSSWQDRAMASFMPKDQEDTL